jgi:hypothetical protein
MEEFSQMSLKLNRRTFIKLSVLAAAGFIAGCGFWNKLGSELKPIAKGFEPYNGINPYARKWQRQTFLDNILEHKVAWAGAQYHNLPPGKDIIAPADGIVYWQSTVNDYHGLEDQIIINHGALFSTTLFHMKAGSCTKEKDFPVKRGEVIARAGHIPFKTKMSFAGIMGDMDDYGERLSYMKPFDDTEPEFGYHNRGGYWGSAQKREDQQKKYVHIDLISELREKYIGPGREKLMDVGFAGVPKSLSHDSSGRFPWSVAMVFRLLNQMYQNHPELYRGTRSENDALINDIYNSQPVVLTLPFKI